MHYGLSLFKKIDDKLHLSVKQVSLLQVNFIKHLLFCLIE